MRNATWLIGVLALLPLGLSAGEQEPEKDYKDFSRLLQRIAVKQLPKEFEDTSGWGQMIPAPPNLRFPLLRRYVKVGDRWEVPHGAWRRFKGKFEDPDRDLKIVVKDFKQREDKTYRLVLDVDATVLVAGEWQQWQKGLLLIGADGVADANITANIVCDIGVTLNLKKFPPELNVAPKVTELTLNLVDFRMRKSPIVLEGERGENLRNELKGVLRSLIKAAEPLIKDKANEAIAQSLKEGKGTISAGAFMKALPAAK